MDKDGTLVEDVPYGVAPAGIRLLPGAAAALRTLDRAGYRCVIVSNQAGVALGRFGEAALVAVGRRIRRLLGCAGARVAGFYACPHHPRGSVVPWNVVCDCRKPRPGLLLRAAADLRIDLAASWMVGDILDDIEAGRRAGCRTVLLDGGGETVWRRSPLRRPDRRTRDWQGVVRAVLGGRILPLPAHRTPARDRRPARATAAHATSLRILPADGGRRS